MEERVGNGSKKGGYRNKTHTLVAHHQVRKTLREDKSTVSTENGIMWKLSVTLTCRHLVKAGCLSCEAWGVLQSQGKEEGGVRARVAVLGKLKKEKAFPQPDGCDALSVTFVRDKSIKESVFVVRDQTFPPASQPFPEI